MTASHLDVRLLNQSREEIEGIIDARSEKILSGALADHAEYRFRSGEIQGLKMALGIMQALVRKMGESNL